MNDAERQLRQLLHEKAGVPVTLVRLPDGVRRRGRLRQLRTISGGVLASVAIVIGLISALSAVTPSHERQPGETGPTTSPHPGEIGSGSEPGLGSWYVTARQRDGTNYLVFHHNDDSFGSGVEPLMTGETLGSFGGAAELVASTDLDPGWVLIMGIAATEVARVDLQLEDGRTVTADLFPMPVDLIGASKAYVAEYRGSWGAVGELMARGQIVAFDADGTELGRQELPHPTVPSSWLAAESDLRNGLTAALTMYADGATFVGFTPEVAATIEPSLTYNAALVARTGEISIRDVTRSTILLVTETVDGMTFCIAEDSTTGATSYGVVDAETAAECHGGEARWGIEQRV